MNWSDPVERTIEIHALAWTQNTRRMARAALRDVDDILYPKRAALRKQIRAEFQKRLANDDKILLAALAMMRNRA